MGDSVVLEEEIDPNYVPSQEEILEYAKWLGMDVEADEDFFYIAKEGLKAPLPSEWKPCKTTDTEEEIYYFNFATGDSTWDHPCDEKYKSMYQAAKKYGRRLDAGDVIKGLKTNRQDARRKKINWGGPFYKVSNPAAQPGRLRSALGARRSARVLRVSISSAIGSTALLKLNISNNDLCAEGGTALAEALIGNQMMTALNIANNSLCVKADRSAGYDWSGVIAIADAMKDMRALSMISLKDNGLLTAEAGKVLSDMVATNTVLKELDLSSNNWKDRCGCLQGDGPGFALALAIGIRNNGALSMLDASDNGMFGFKDMSGITAWAASLKANTSITELNLAKNGINADDAKILAPAISDNGALSTITVHKFPLPIQDIKTKAELDLFCPRSSTTFAPGKELNYLDTIIIAALLPLNVSGTIFGSPYYR
jgi:hypothetical protein